MLKIISVFFVLFLFKVRAQDCSEINFYDRESNPIHEIKLYDQKSLNTCYAYSISQLWEFQNRSSGMNESVSPLWVALNSKENRKLHYQPRHLDYNYILWTIKDIKKTGGCTQDYVDQKLHFLKSINENIDEVDLILFLQEIWLEYERLIFTHPFQKRGVSFYKSYEKISQLKKFKDKFKVSIAKEIERMSFYGFLQFPKFLKNEILGDCTGGAFLKAPEFEHQVFLSKADETTAKLFSRKLSSTQPSPLAIGYCSRVWNSEPGTSYLPHQFSLDMINKINNCGAHYSVVVGQKKMNGQCHYLVRNTWGDMWGRIFRKCHVEFKGKRFDTEMGMIQNDKRVRVLGCWISREDLFNNMFDLSYLK